ncbi:MAG TPA: hypothetical protein VKB51_14345 [bacterium]|nr:hypothetical protein [bacterium]
MYGVTSTTGKTNEASLRPQNADVLLRQRPQEQQRPPVLDGHAGQEDEGSQYVPSRYMVLISRIDRMQSQGQLDRPLVDRLTSLLGQRLAALSPAVRRTLQELPEVRALGVDNLLQLPRVIAAHLHAGTQREAVMALLRSPEFAAAIKDESRTATYTPQGLLRAS